MPKKQITKQRTQVKDLPKKEKKLSTSDMKKVRGGIKVGYSEQKVLQEAGMAKVRLEYKD